MKENKTKNDIRSHIDEMSMEFTAKEVYIKTNPKTGKTIITLKGVERQDE